MAWQLRVIDGADQGRFFPLPETGSVVVGHSHKHCDVFLNDIYVSRVHCHIDVEGDAIKVFEDEPTGGTFVNGQSVAKQQLQPNDVLRVGNSHLKLEPYVAPPPQATVASTLGGVPHLPPERLAELSGQKLGHFELKEVIGQGHCGVTFHAYDLKELHPVAVKVLAPDFPKDKPELERFAAAVKPALAVRHPHVVTLNGVGKTSGYCWMSMELIEGESVADALERIAAGSKPKWPHAVRLGIHLAKGLHFLHRHKLIHGNLSPNNILIKAADKTAKLNDVALAKGLEGTALMQRVGEKKLVAEMAYRAPEQFQPGGFLDATTDLYSLGAVIYARLTGRPPYRGATPQEVRERIEDGVLVKPMKFQPTMPAVVEKIVLKMLSRHQEDRFKSALEVSALLERAAEENGMAV
jgi:serine/threonine protein kinase